MNSKIASSNVSDYWLHAREGEEEYIPKHGIDQDARFFDLDSLVRMYGEEEVSRYLAALRRRR